MSLKDIIGDIGDAGKKLLGGGIGGGDFFSNLLANTLTSKVLGGDTKDALMFTALQQGLGTGGLFGAEKATQPEQMSRIQKAISGISEENSPGYPFSPEKSIQKILADKSKVAAVTPFKQDPKTLGFAKFLIDLGVLSPDSKATSLLNSRVGEALALGLGSTVADKLFSEEEKEFTPRPFGGTTKPVYINQGGYIDGQYFPRRDGGIMPSEGSGTKDDVPAMLTAGEFVLTRDAVKGLGNGNLNRGIQEAYSMMDNLERRA